MNQKLKDYQKNKESRKRFKENKKKRIKNMRKENQKKQGY